MPRIRLNIFILDRSYAELTELAAKYKFNSVCEVVMSLVKLFIMHEAGLISEDSAFSEFGFDHYILSPESTANLNRHRINLTIAEPLNIALRDLAKTRGFSSLQSFVSALVEAYLNDVRTSATKESDEDDISAEVSAMFSELSDAQPTPSNTTVPKIHRYREQNPTTLC